MENSRLLQLPDEILSHIMWFSIDVGRMCPNETVSLRLIRREFQLMMIWEYNNISWMEDLWYEHDWVCSISRGINTCHTLVLFQQIMPDVRANWQYLDDNRWVIRRSHWAYHGP